MSMKIVERWVDMDVNKIAVVFPGIGYHKDKPLLYYAAKLAKQHGYEIISIEYHDMPQKIRGNSEMMAIAAELAIVQSRDALQNIPINSATELLLIGKSIGTVAAAQFAAECDANIRQIWYTPLEATFAIGSHCPCIAFLGEDDPWSDVEKVNQMAETLHIPMDTYSGCNHSLECGDVMRNLEILQDVMEKTAVYLRNAFPDQCA